MESTLHLALTAIKMITALSRQIIHGHWDRYMNFSSYFKQQIIFNKPVFSFLRMLTMWHCPHSSASTPLLPCSSRSISPARQVHSSKPATAGLLLWTHAGQRDGETNTRTDNVLSNSPYYVGSVSSFLTAHTHPFDGPLSRTARVGRYQKGKTNLDFTEARDSE